MTEWVATSIDISDDTFILSSVSSVAAVVRDESRWRQWWPDRVLTVYSDRGDKGLRWTVAGEFVGSSEIWIEESVPGVIVHYYLRVDPTREGSSHHKQSLTGSPRSQRFLAKAQHRQVTTWKRIIWDIKDELEGRKHLA
ncbi:MAG: hypothetical protein K9G12_06485 [Candidatus Nanopelagicales bacterium]|nr:hypothetical protein [Candidatus Nanopelagicales bacterium]MCF8539911.1 hypothetical protein [Candidatus Nanopelagicales bacterium]